MRLYLDERIAEEKREQAGRVPFRREFYADDCNWGNRPGYLEMFQSEKVLSISVSDSKAEVITSRENARTPGAIYDLRYHLQANNGGWQIYEVDLRCCSCSGEPGNSGCPSCHGTGWRGTNKMLANPSNRSASTVAEDIRR